MKTLRHLGAAIGAALLCAAGAAQANQNETSVSYANLQYQVIDLTPNDGVAAGFTITQSFTSVDLFTLTPYGMTTWQKRVSSDQGAPLSASLQRENISLQGSTTGSANGMLSGVISDQDTIDSRGKGAVRSIITFELAPNTALLLTGDLSVTLGQDTGLPPGVGSIGRGFIDMQLSPTEQSVTSHATATLGRNTWQHGTGTFDQDLSLVLSNHSDQVRRGSSRIELLVDTRYYTAGGVPAVPEPSTYLMLGAGLAIAGVMARRRKQA